MPALTALSDVEVERRPRLTIPKGHWMGCFPHLSDDELRARAKEWYRWDEIEIQRWPGAITLIRPKGHE